MQEVLDIQFRFADLTLKMRPEERDRERRRGREEIMLTVWSLLTDITATHQPVNKQ